jgi:hypothetical protein
LEKLHNVEFHKFYSSPRIIIMIKTKRMRCAGYVTQLGENRNRYGILVGKPVEKRPLGRPRRLLMDNIKIDLREIR